MKKKIFSLLLIVLFFSISTGCGDSKSDFPDNITTTEFSNDILSLKYPDTYTWENVTGDVYIFNHNRTSNTFHMRPSIKHGNSLEDETKYFIDLSNEISERNGFEQKATKIEDIEIDGKNAKFVTFENGIKDGAFLLIDYSTDSYYLIDFYFEFYEDNIQIIKAIAASIRFT